MRTSIVARWVASGLWLLLVWLLLWGSVDPLVVASGLVVAAACLRFSAIPGLPFYARPRWLLVPWLLGRFAADLVKSSLGVLVATWRHRRQVRAAIVAVRMPPHLSDVAVTAASNRLSLVPGTLVVDMDRTNDLLYVYVLDIEDQEAAEAAREELSRIVADVARVLPPVREERR